MIFDLPHILLFIGLFLSLSFNVILYLYIKQSLSSTLQASEQVSEILTMMDAFRAHLKSVYEMPMFYGDETLSSLLDHTNDMNNFLVQYDSVYSLTQPDLLELLEEGEADGPQEEE
tara:strand:- start:1897 stop:2244 length:348 start_codon:yes stop_codon:yes gene_type:complete